MGGLRQGALRAPEPLGPDHEVEEFDSGASGLDTWLKRRARGNQVSGASRTYVLCRDRRVVGFYALAAGSVTHDHLEGRSRRNMPDPVPVIILGRLAVDHREQGQGLGRALLRDALLRVHAAAREIGVAAVLVHALDDRARAFYLSNGFSPSGIEPLTLMMRLVDIAAAVRE